MLELYVPNIKTVLNKFLATDEDKVLEEIYGEQKHELDYYKSAWTFESLDRVLSQINFVRVSTGKQSKHRPDAISILAYKLDE
jgi:hypothetical protein